MKEPIDGEHTLELLVRAGAAGFAVTERQLKRWHGLLPRPRQSWEAGKPGSEAIYPSGTGDQLICLCGLQKKFRRLNKIGQALWWLGFDVDEKYWKTPLAKQATWYDHIVPRVITTIKIGLNEQDMGDHPSFWSRLKAARVSNPLFRQLRKRLGGRFTNFFFLLSQILEGQFDGWPPSAESPINDQMTMDRALGLFRDRAGVENQGNYGDVESALVTLSARLGGARMTDILQSASAVQIFNARNKLRLILAVMRITSKSVDVKKMGLGLKVVAKYAEYFEIPIYQLLLLFLLALEEDSEFKANLDQFIGSLRKEILPRIPPEQIDLIQHTDPSLSQILLQPE